MQSIGLISLSPLPVVAPPSVPSVPIVSQVNQVPNTNPDVKHEEQARTPVYDKLQTILDSEIHLSFTRLVDLASGRPATPTFI